MAKQTLLGMTQDILSSIDGDEVNSITDNVESMQVARIIRSCFRTITSRTSIPEHHELFELESSGSSGRPTLMTLPTNVVSFDWVKYNQIAEDEDDANFQMMTPLSLANFLERMHELKETDDNVGTFTVSGVEYYYTDDKAPEYYTSPDDLTFIFDSYDAEVDTILQGSKTLAYGEVDPTFSLQDSFTPDLDAKQFDLLFNESKALAFAEMKQAQHVKAESNARQGWIQLQKRKDNVLGDLSDMRRIPNFGRNRGYSNDRPLKGRYR